MYVKFNSWIVYDFKSTNENFYVSGYVVSNNYESRVVINNFLSDNYLLNMDDISYIEMNIYVGDEVVYNYQSKEDANVVDLFFKDVGSISFKTSRPINNKDDIKCVYIVISFEESKHLVDDIIYFK